jgi:hypothetical protein
MAPEFGKSIHHLPLIPATVLKKHLLHEPLDLRDPSREPRFAPIHSRLFAGRP